MRNAVIRRAGRARQERWWAVEVLDEDNEWADFMVRHATRKDAREYALNVAKDLPELRLRLVAVVERRVTVEKVKDRSSIMIPQLQSLNP